MKQGVLSSFVGPLTIQTNLETLQCMAVGQQCGKKPHLLTGQTVLKPSDFSKSRLLTV